MMAAVKVAHSAPHLERRMAETRIANGQIATLLSEIDAGIYDRDQALLLINEIVANSRSPGLWTEIRRSFKR